MEMKNDDLFGFLDDIGEIKNNTASTERKIEEVNISENKQVEEQVQLEAEKILHMNNGKKVPLSNTKTLAIQGLSKLNKISEDLNKEFFEREHVIKTILRGLISGQPVLLLGEPGTGKSAFITALTKRIENANYFQWLLNRTSDPAEILGPYSIKDMENDKFKRVTTGKLPEAEITFVDEIFKANEPTLNMLLPIINEKIFYNDGVATKVPLLGFFCASNETPEEGEGLEALYDRIINKVYVNYISDKSNKEKMFLTNIAKRNGTFANSLNNVTISIDEIRAMQEEVNYVEVPKSVLKDFNKIINALMKDSMVFSDRRQNECIKALQTEAFINGRDKVIDDDFIALTDILWIKESDITTVESEIKKIVDPYSDKYNEYLRKFNEIKSDIESVSDPALKANKSIEAKKSFENMTKKINTLINQGNRNGKDMAKLEKLKKNFIEYNEKLLRETLGLNDTTGNSLFD